MNLFRKLFFPYKSLSEKRLCQIITLASDLDTDHMLQAVEYLQGVLQDRMERNRKQLANLEKLL